MKKKFLIKSLAATMLGWTIFAAPLAAIAQTRLQMPKNKYKIEQDIKIGRESAQKVEQQMPILRDDFSTNFVQSVGRRIVNGIPSQFQQSAFQYSFKIVNARDINAFALPGGPMYVNRGMITAAKSEGEMAGVMAHEICHVAMRHGTAGATKQGSFGTQLGTIGLILGGAILGGEAGAQLGAVGVAAWLTKYSREYETQADICGAQTMARAGYDPRDLANMFKTIERQGGGSRGPEWLSSHPNPNNRYQRIEQEAALLRVEGRTESSREFYDVQRRLNSLPQAPTMAEIEKGGARTGQTGGTRTGNYSRSVPRPSSRYKTFSGGNWMRVNVPDNWGVNEQEASVEFAPEGAYGSNGITHGLQIALVNSRNQDLQSATDAYVRQILQDNNYLRSQSRGYSPASVGGRSGLTIQLAGTSPITGSEESVTIYTTQLRNGQMLSFITVAPTNEMRDYNLTFRTVLRSLQVND